MTQASEKADMKKKSSSIDQGWAWMVLWAGVLGNLILWGSCYNVGILNVLFLEAFNDTRSNTAWIGAVSTCLISSIGPISSIFVNKIGFRWTVILGGALTAIGSCTSFFATKVIHLVLSFGVIGGFGLGLCYTPIISVVALYFEKYRIMATALSSVGSGVGTIIFAPMIQTLADTYDWRGAMLIIGAIQLHLCVCGALLRPLPAQIYEESVDQTTCEPPAIAVDDKEKTPEPSTKLFQFEVLKNPRVLIFMSNILFINLGLFIVYLHMSAYAITEGASHVEAALLMSLAGIASILSRVLIPAAATDSRVGVLLVYAGSLGVCGFVIFVTPPLMSYVWGQMVMAFFFGFYANGYVPLMTPLAVEFVGLKLLTAACGMVNLTSGIGTLLGPPLAGWIYDVTGGYEYGFFLAGAMLLCSAFIMYLVPLLASSKKYALPEEGLPQKVTIIVGDSSPRTTKSTYLGHNELGSTSLLEMFSSSRDLHASLKCLAAVGKEPPCGTPNSYSSLKCLANGGSSKRGEHRSLQCLASDEKGGKCGVGPTALHSSLKCLKVAVDKDIGMSNDNEERASSAHCLEIEGKGENYHVDQSRIGIEKETVT